MSKLKLQRKYRQYNFVCICFDIYMNLKNMFGLDQEKAIVTTQTTIWTHVLQKTKHPEPKNLFSLEF